MKRKFVFILGYTLILCFVLNTGCMAAIGSAMPQTPPPPPASSQRQGVNVNQKSGHLLVRN